MVTVLWEVCWSLKSLNIVGFAVLGMLLMRTGWQDVQGAFAPVVMGLLMILSMVLLGSFWVSVCPF